MQPIEAYFKIREACLRRPELKFKTYPDVPSNTDLGFNPYFGFCYVASFAFQVLVPEAEVWSFGRNHFFNKVEGKVWDLTAEQFHQIMPYNEAKRTKAKKGPTERVKLLLEEVYARS